MAVPARDEEAPPPGPRGVIDPVAFVLTVTAVVLAAVVAAHAVHGAPPGRAVVLAVVALQGALLVQAAVDVAVWTRGHRVGEPGVHAAYLATSVAVLPVAAAYGARGRDRWGVLVVALALLVVAVLQVRLMTTWRSPA